MLRLLSSQKLLTFLIVFAGIILAYILLGDKPIDFNTQVKPILNKKCISCHGGVKKKGGFSVLFEEEALAKTESGKPAIIPGDPHASEMIIRLTNADPEERMPYKEPSLSEEEIDILTNWVKQGAKWGKHWAYESVKEQKVPSLSKRFLGLLPSLYTNWVRNPIDHFILEKLEEKELTPSAEADKLTLLRRVSLDIIGMPAPDSIAIRFLNNPSDQAYPELVESLLALPQFGERWTAMWMDLSRYADTKGYERDDHRQIWRYRDWLIKSFNDDKPYDQFITEQLAGDLLPSPTDAQYLATAFHRNTMTNDEGGTDNEEFRTAAVMDRVNTTWEVLMGTTFACVQCHSHPYDPFKYEDYYKFMAFFNNTRDEDSYSEYPLLYEFKNEDSLRFIQVNKWLKQNVDPHEAETIIQFLRTRQPSINSLNADQFVNSELSDTKWLSFRNYSSARLKKVDLNSSTKLISRYVAWIPDGKLEIHIDSLNGPLLSIVNITNANKGWVIDQFPIKRVTGKHDIFFKYRSKTLEKDRNGLMLDWLYFTNEFPGATKPDYDSIKKAFNYLIAYGQSTTTPIMMENPNQMFRPTQIFDRGNWTQKGAFVKPGVPASLNPMPNNAPQNRLGLARWMTDKVNPLTSRTITNRIWEQLFGQGLVETLEDMGSQGIAPTHPELLDYLSWNLMHKWNWSLKSLMREIVFSATYRQTSKATPQQMDKDRFNKWYARGPRFRLTAEQIRDQALAVSGVMNTELYGPSKMPWQPEGIWNSPYNGNQWKTSNGDDKYRRAIYTYWKRTSAYPSLLTFDAMQREVCVSRRIRTNTPLQALTILNDPAYVDISRQWTLNLLKESSDPFSLIRKAYKKATGKTASDQVIKPLINLYFKALNKYSNDIDATCEMSTGFVNDPNNKPETAALIMVIHSIMNLDDVITKS